MTATIASEFQEIHIPSWVVDLSSFRQWARSDDFPGEGRIYYLGEIWIDTTMEQLFSHNQVKNEISFVLTGLTKTSCPGTYFPDRASLTNAKADLSTIPDGLFVSVESFESGAIKLGEGARDGFVEIEGAPDMVLEIVSDSSVRKDKTELKKRYAEAGVREYWVVDARKPPLEFVVYRLGKQGFKAAPRAKDGWIKSQVFGEAFRLTESNNAAGHPEFSLECRG